MVDDRQGDGSSPSNPHQLRRQLARLDRKLARIDRRLNWLRFTYQHRAHARLAEHWKQLDIERRSVRNAIKYRRT